MTNTPPTPTFETRCVKRVHDDSDDDVEVPPLPDELQVLADQLLVIGENEDIHAWNTRIKVSHLLDHFWFTWWSK